MSDHGDGDDGDDYGDNDYDSVVRKFDDDDDDLTMHRPSAGQHGGVLLQKLRKLPNTSYLESQV